jgi:hypothetical protein
VAGGGGSIPAGSAKGEEEEIVESALPIENPKGRSLTKEIALKVWHIPGQKGRFRFRQYDKTSRSCLELGGTGRGFFCREGVGAMDSESGIADADKRMERKKLIKTMMSHHRNQNQRSKG